MSKLIFDDNNNKLKELKKTMNNFITNYKKNKYENENLRIQYNALKEDYDEYIDFTNNIALTCLTFRYLKINDQEKQFIEEIIKLNNKLNNNDININININNKEFIYKKLLILNKKLEAIKIEKDAIDMEKELIRNN